MHFSSSSIREICRIATCHIDCYDLVSYVLDKNENAHLIIVKGWGSFFPYVLAYSIIDFLIVLRRMKNFKLLICIVAGTKIFG